jgi:L-lysine exporter family protein LysE/ArgO
MLFPVISGFLLGGSLIVAIGAQNAFVIRQGIVGHHVFWICLFCAICDALLIIAGVAGLGALIKSLPWFLSLITYGGVAFLGWHGVKALMRVMRPTVLSASDEVPLSLQRSLLACAGFTLLNPHVYLDTVLLVGSIANARATGEQWPFAAGAALASFIWFFSIGYGALAARQWLGRPTVWRTIDGFIALVMFALAAKLLLG